MRPFSTLSMRYDGNNFMILDQTLLPQQEQWVTCDTAETLIDCMKRLAIRGAPAIGIASAVLLAVLAKSSRPRNLLIHDAQQLRQARPTAVNLHHCIDQMMAVMNHDNYPSALAKVAEEIIADDIELCHRIAHFGTTLVNTGNKILTHCNTGGLATAGAGTAMAIITEAHRQKKEIFVWVDETRPLLQGGRLTAWECLQHGIAHSIICDSCAAMLMARGEVDIILVGSDRIAANGDFANKIGTYALSVLARHHNIPFYVAAPQTTIDPKCTTGDDIPIEQRPESEVKGVHGSFGSCQWSPAESPALNLAFDITPAELVSGWIIDTGIFTLEDVTRADWWKKN